VQWFDSIRWWLSPREPYILINVVTQWVEMGQAGRASSGMQAQHGFSRKSSRLLTLGLLVLDIGLSHV
jgi:hypothetical protein